MCRDWKDTELFFSTILNVVPIDLKDGHENSDIGVLWTLSKTATLNTIPPHWRNHGAFFETIHITCLVP